MTVFYLIWIISGGGAATAYAPFDTFLLCDAARTAVLQMHPPGRTVTATCVAATVPR